MIEELGRYIKDRGYLFHTTTPETHRRLLERDGENLLPSPSTTEAQILQALFGWNKFVPDELVEESIKKILIELGAVKIKGHIKSPIRFSSLNSLLFAHSAFPTVERDAVFFGPDSYRFVRYAKHKINKSAQKVADLGCGSGVGGLSIASSLENLEKLFLTDINDKALLFARSNCAINRATPTEVFKSDLFKQLPPRIDVVIANPPFIVDRQKRAYRDGGGALGEQLSVRIVEEAIEYFQAGGQLILYTGTAIVNGEDQLQNRFKKIIAGRDVDFEYEEIDPDIFGEELSNENYKGVERLAAVGLTLHVHPV